MQFAPTSVLRSPVIAERASATGMPTPGDFSALHRLQGPELWHHYSGAAAVGRAHAYEGHDTDAIMFAVRTAITAGCRVVVLANAAGCCGDGMAVATWPSSPTM